MIFKQYDVAVLHIQLVSITIDFLSEKAFVIHVGKLVVLEVDVVIFIFIIIFIPMYNQGGKCVRNYLLSSLGYVVISIDSRGSSNRGKAFESHIYKRLGQVELKDQLEVLEKLAKDFSFLDLTRVAINGWSYGGYLALRGIVDHPDLFKVL